MLASALADVVSLGAVIPFLGVLAAPDKLLAYPGIARMAGVLHIRSAEEMALLCTLLFVAATLVAAAVRVLLLWSNVRFGFAAGADLGTEVYRRTLYQPYQVHVARNSSEVISAVVHKVNTVLYGILIPLLALASSVLMIVAVMTALIMIDAVVAIIAAAAFGSCYALITYLARHELARSSRRMADEETRILQALQEGLGGIRDVLLDGTQSAYCETFRRADRPLRRAQAITTFIGQSPRYFMEALGILLIASLAYALSRDAGGIAPAIPLLGALALGAQRLLPALQQTYHAWTYIAGSTAALSDVLDLLDQPLPQAAAGPASPPFPFQHSIRFEGVWFRYADDSSWVLKGIDLTIPRGSRVALVGATGSGKSTTADLLMGLLEPTRGSVLVDGRPLSGSTVRGWQQTLAHVPQSIFLTDASIAANIALGVPSDKIDMTRVRKAAREAEIAEFIESRPQGYEALVGERGIRLSGGERQRIGIARALYKQTDVLVLDEATSALDYATEQSIMRTIEGLSRELTIVLVSHRLSTVRWCDMIVELENGRAEAQGTFVELVERSASFRKLVEASG